MEVRENSALDSYFKAQIPSQMVVLFSFRIKQTSQLQRVKLEKPQPKGTIM